MRMEAVLPEWAMWKVHPDLEPWTVGIEEEVMLLEPDGSPAWRSEDVLRVLPDALAEHTRGETHGLALELATDPHRTVCEATTQLRQLRAGLSEAVRGLGLRAAVAGTHPMVRAEDVQVSPGARYQYLHSSLRELARREPTFALHVHVAVPDPELAVRAYNGIRAHIPVLLALAANSPFTRGRDSGLASARTPVFQAFPRTGIPREFATYSEYAEAVDVLIRCGAIPEPTFIWWDVRLQPKLGTLEVRVMDAQTRIRDTAALVALVQCLVRIEALDHMAEPELSHATEVLDENRFLAARDGIRAQLLDPLRDRCVPASGRLATLVDACWPHARALGCERELGLLAHLAGDPGADRQRAIASERQGLGGLVRALQGEFSPPRPQLAAAA
ncbi:carboxylate-amine ligase [Solirubrobacter ginsenosidimutans]|nr:YbdK family carboxylate-amine ligase [Solirubrobacter ginsenosidimutans]